MEESMMADESIVSKAAFNSRKCSSYGNAIKSQLLIK
jgi:hypothetical protein